MWEANPVGRSGRSKVGIGEAGLVCHVLVHSSRYRIDEVCDILEGQGVPVDNIRTEVYF